MSERKHTPGPWSVCWRNSRKRTYAAGDYWETPVAVGSPETQGNTIATVGMGGAGALRSTKESVEANARLIAAAPELLEACIAGFNALYDLIQSEFATSHDPHPADSDPDVVMLRAAIAKAKGEENPVNQAEVQQFVDRVKAAIEEDK